MKRLILLFFILTLLPLKINGGEWYDFCVPRSGAVWCRTGAGSTLTYGHKPDEPYRKLFLLSCYQGHYYFFWTFAIPYAPNYLTWSELPAPNPGVSPQPDGALSYFYDSRTNEEKVLAIFGGGIDVWCYDVPTQTWTKEARFHGTPPNITPMAAGGSLEFWRYNRGPMNQPPRSVSYPPWEQLEPFGGPNNSEPFYAGADLALYYPDPYSSQLHDTIFAMRGARSPEDGRPFALYHISGNCWEPKDLLMKPGCDIGGALVSHPKWFDIGGEAIPGDTGTDNEGYSILHCFRGNLPEDYNDHEFDCFEVPDPTDPGRWYGIPPDPSYNVGSGSDLVYGAYWYDPPNQNDSICCI